MLGLRRTGSSDLSFFRQYRSDPTSPKALFSGVNYQSLGQFPAESTRETLRPVITILASGECATYHNNKKKTGENPGRKNEVDENKKAVIDPTKILSYVSKYRASLARFRGIESIIIDLVEEV